jgi:hypothetical protein
MDAKTQEIINKLLIRRTTAEKNLELANRREVSIDEKFICLLHGFIDGVNAALALLGHKDSDGGSK